MGRRLKDLTGARFGKLTVIERAPSQNGHTLWKCRCDCGNTKIVDSYDLQHRKYISCGCIKKPSPKRIAMIGKRIGMLTVIGEAPNPYGIKACAWKCRCDCGNTIVAVGTLLRRGYYSSCGCNKPQKARELFTKHGKANTRLYKIWSCMKQRCYYPKYVDYHCYGGKGVKVCNEWLKSFQAFYEWAMAAGYKDNLSIDRIDVDGDYEPDNCRWSTDKEQANNKTTNHYITYDNETHTLSEWSAIKHIKYDCLRARIYAGWDIGKALNEPSRGRVKRRL